MYIFTFIAGNLTNHVLHQLHSQIALLHSVYTKKKKNNNNNNKKENNKKEKHRS